jgi:hypothetical protein
MASTSQAQSSLPHRGFRSHPPAPPHNFGASQQPAAALRDKPRLDRERAERERLAREAQVQGQAGAPAANPMNTLSDEQREEINEAVCILRITFCTSMAYSVANSTMRPLRSPSPSMRLCGVYKLQGCACALLSRTICNSP